MTAKTETAKATTTPAAKPKIDPAKCRGGEGRYLSAPTAKACKNERAKGKQLCPTCEKAYATAKKAAKAASGAPQTSQKPAKPAKASNVTPIKSGPTPARKGAPRPEAKAIRRVPATMAAMVLPTVTPAPSSND